MAGFGIILIVMILGIPAWVFLLALVTFARGRHRIDRALVLAVTAAFVGMALVGVHDVVKYPHRWEIELIEAAAFALAATVFWKLFRCFGDD